MSCSKAERSPPTDRSTSSCVSVVFILPADPYERAGGMVSPGLIQARGAPAAVARTWRSAALGDRGGQLDLDVVRIPEGQHVDAESFQCFDLAVRHPSLVEQAHCLLQLVTAADAEAEVVEADPVLVEAVALRRHRPETHEQAAADHDAAAPQQLVHRRGRGVVCRW